MIYIFVVIVSLVLDQLTKQLIVSKLNLHQSVPVIGTFFKITYTRNTGGAFSILKNHPGFLTWLSVILCVISLLFIIKIIRSGLFYQMGIGLVIGGTLGNLVDRLRFGYVIDFIDFSFWATFNVADIAITLGSFLLIYTVFKDESGKDGQGEDADFEFHEPYSVKSPRDSQQAGNTDEKADSLPDGPHCRNQVMQE